MAAGKYDTVIEQGTNWSLTLTLKKPSRLPVDLTGYQVKSTIKKAFTDTEVLATPVSVVLDPPAAGKINLSLDHTVTQSLDFFNGVYDVVVKSPSGKIVRLLQGTVKFSPEVTQWYPSVSGYSGV